MLDHGELDDVEFMNNWFTTIEATDGPIKLPKNWKTLKKEEKTKLVYKIMDEIDSFVMGLQ